MAAVASLMALSVLLRTGIFDGVGDYSDIDVIYRREDLSGHPVPYFDYELEYPVLIGAFQWLAGIGSPGYKPYFVLSAGGLTALAIATAWLLGRLRGANAWLLAASPAVVFWGVQNWDFVAICPLAAALVLHQREHDAWGAAALAVAVSAKLFPIVVLPVVVVIRLAQRRSREAAVVAGVFGLVTVALNAPVAIELQGSGIDLRDSWALFFEFSRDRPPLATLWPSGPDRLAQVNIASAVLLGLGLALLLALTFRRVRCGGDVLVPAAGAALLWLFATTKVYSVQFALWIMLALALTGVPVSIAAVFVAVDVLIFVTFWTCVSCVNDVPGALRHVVTALLAAFALGLVARGAPRATRARGR